MCTIAVRTPRAWVGLAASLLLVTTVGAQEPFSPRPANPAALEFEFPVDESSVVEVAFAIAIVPASSDASTATPVGRLETTRSRLVRGLVRVDLREALEGVPDGEYVAVVSRLNPDGTHGASVASVPFAVFGRSPDAPQRTATVVSAAAPTPHARSERFWTRVSIAIGAGLLLLPLLF